MSAHISGPATWPVSIAVEFCNGTRQSPININSSMAEESATLVDFTFTNYDNKQGLTKIKNTGKTGKSLTHALNCNADFN